MRLAQATGHDVFFDLGCGMGKLCVVAVKEFGVRKAVGIELHRGRAAKAARYVQDSACPTGLRYGTRTTWSRTSARRP